MRKVSLKIILVVLITTVMVLAGIYVLNKSKSTPSKETVSTPFRLFY